MKRAGRDGKVVPPRLRETCADDVALRPGKAELLALRDQTGGIAEAVKRTGMSYTRAWTLIRTMNGCFKEPLVTPVRGGTKGGGATLTATGRQAMDLSRRAVVTSWPMLSRLLRG